MPDNSAPIDLVVNGAPHSHNGDGRLTSLLSEMNAPADRVAIVVNEEVVPKSELDTATLGDGDRVEILTFAAGG